MSLDRADGRSLRSGFLRAAAEFGNGPALVVKGREFAYRELEEAARRWAAALSDTRVFYRTGDRVRQQPSGDYAYLGRVDHQINVHGYRVELGEIEAAILRCPGGVAAAAIGWPLEDGRPEGIVGFAVGQDVEPDTLRSAVRDWLPAYMLPAEVRILDALPLNVNGKTDRAALMSMLDDRTSGTDVA